MKLHTYFRSSAAFRVRIALNLKKLDYEHAFVNLVKGEQRSDAYLALNPQGLVPALEEDGRLFTQSLAIIEYLDERHPEPPLVPRDTIGRARVRALALAIACDIHPLNNTRVLQYLERDLGLSTEQRNAWYAHWIAEGFRAFEQALAAPETGRFCHGDTPTLADIALVPQVFNAHRFKCDVEPYPRIRRIHEACLAISAFRDAAPENQSDAVAVKS